MDAVITPVAEAPTGKAQGAIPPAQETVEQKAPLSKFDEARLRFQAQQAQVEEEKNKAVTPPEKEVPVTTPEEGVKPEAGSVVVVDGKEIPKDEFLTENLKSTEFEVYVGDKAHPIKGIDELMRYASMGINSTEKNTLAKQAVAEAQKTVAEVQASVNQEAKRLADSMLSELVDKVSKGIDPGTGQPFASPEHRAGAEELTLKLLDAKKGLAPTQENSKVETLEQELKALRQELQDKEQGSKRAQADQQAQAILEKAKAPFTQDPVFLKADGKINTVLFNQFGAAVEMEIRNQAQRIGRTLSLTEAENLFNQATKTVYASYKEAFENYAENKIQGKVKNKPIAPIRPSGEAPKAPLKAGSQAPAKSVDAEFQKRLAAARAAGKWK